MRKFALCKAVLKYPDKEVITLKYIFNQAIVFIFQRLSLIIKHFPGMQRHSESTYIYPTQLLGQYLQLVTGLVFLSDIARIFEFPNLCEITC